MRNDHTPPTRRAWISTFLAAITFTLAACGGGGGDSSSPSPATETLFVADNAWRTTTPTDAETVAPDEFRRLQVAGDLQIVTPATQQAQRVAHQRQVDAERAFLESKSDLSEDVKALLAQSRGATDIEGEPVATLPNNQKVALIDLGTRIESAAANYRLAHDPANALASYALSYVLLTEALQAQVPTPVSLRGATLDQIQQATRQMDAALAAQVNLDNTRLDADAPPPTPVPLTLTRTGASERG